MQTVCVVGAGQMGSQIATITALHGFEVRLYDLDPAMLARAETWLDGWLKDRIAKGRLSPEQTETCRSNLTFLPDLATAAAGADLCIEAVVERLEVKREVFAQLDRLAPPHAILATNSSTIVSSKLADATTRPDKVANLHYFIPAVMMPAVEVVKGPHTSAETAQALVEFCRRTGKVPIYMEKEIYGFIANRLLGAVMREACFLYDNGYASVEDIDLAAEKALAFPMGPFRLMDFTGIDVNYYAQMQAYKESGEPEDLPARCITEKYEQGELGRKTGRGFYEYPKKV